MEKTSAPTRVIDMTSDTQTKYIPVDLTSLQTGQLVDRPLFVHLASNDRYILLVKPLHPLEERVLQKFTKVGQAFSTQEAVDVVFAGLKDCARVVRETCDDEALAPFEKNRLIFEKTKWLAERVFRSQPDAMAALFFFHRAFGVPKPETLIYLSDISVDMYERSLKLAAVSGLLALWLGYSNTAFLAQFAESVFCEEIGKYQEKNQERSHHEVSWEMIEAGLVPGVEAADFRFRARSVLGEKAAFGIDELYEVVAQARRICGETSAVQSLQKSRVFRKLEMIFDMNSSGKKEAA